MSLCVSLLMASSLGGAVMVSPPIAKADIQSQIYFNARQALREGDVKETLRLWLLRNTTESLLRHYSPFDADFRSVAWAALGQRGYCQDGLGKDEEGAGLWPLAMHNWVVKNMRSEAETPDDSPFEAFELGKQRRFISMHDVLDHEELRYVRFFRGSCSLGARGLMGSGLSPFADLADREVTAKLLRMLLMQAKETLAPSGIHGKAVIDARIFDIDLNLARIEARKKRRESRQKGRRARALGMSKGEVKDMQGKEEKDAYDPLTAQARLLEASTHWSVAEWLSLSQDRRLFLFHHASKRHASSPAVDALKVGILDRLIERADGQEAVFWIAHATALGSLEERRLIWDGERGKALLSLDMESGFREHSVIAMHRGVFALQQGKLKEALRLMALSLATAEYSKASEELTGLGRRWVSFVASQFSVDDELLAMLKSLLPRQDFATVLEDLSWHAALSADRESFDRCLQYQQGYGAGVRRTRFLGPLAKGNSGAFLTTVRQGLEDETYFLMRFLKKFLDRLARENLDVRRRHQKTLGGLESLLGPMAPESGKRGGIARRAGELLESARVLLAGLEGAGPLTQPARRARTLSPDASTYAGSVRLAPTDPLPWPFALPEVSAPAVFTPIPLTPIEWTDTKGRWVFGWQIGKP